MMVDKDLQGSREHKEDKANKDQLEQEVMMERKACAGQQDQEVHLAKLELLVPVEHREDKDLEAQREDKENRVPEERPVSLEEKERSAREVQQENAVRQDQPEIKESLVNLVQMDKKGHKDHGDVLVHRDLLAIQGEME